MKRIFLIYLVLFICVNNYAQMINQTRTCGITTISDFYARFPRSTGNIIELVGWSDTGLLAYFQRDVDQHTWLITINLVIFDTVRNSIISEHKISFHNEFDEETDSFIPILPSEEIEILLRNWNNMLERNGINERIHTFNQWLNFTQFAVFPHIRGEVSYDSWFDTEIEEDDSSFSFQWIIRWSLIVSNGSQTKIIASGEEYNFDPHGYRGSTVLGYYKSPYENRLVVITAHHFMFLGDHSHRITLYGFYLGEGFY